MGLGFGTALAQGVPADTVGIGTYQGEKVLLHKVTAKETFYSLARKYNVHPKYLIRYNTHIHKLKIGDTVRIAIDSLNTFQNVVLVPDNDKQAGEKPVATAAESRPGRTGPDTSAESARDETDIAPPKRGPEAAETGSTGFASSGNIHIVQPKETLFAISRKYGLTVAELREMNQLKGSSIEAGQSLIVSAEPGSPEKDPAPAKPLEDEPGEIADNPETTSTPSIFQTPDQATKNDTESNNKKSPSPLPKVVREVNEAGMAAWLNDASINQAKSVALHKTAPKGSIIKVTNPTNKRSIMVKVVGGIPENAETEHALIIISKSASELLGVDQNRFRVNLNYAIQE